MINDCQVKPSQYIKKKIPKYKINSFEVKSFGNFFCKFFENPNITLIQFLKKKIELKIYKKIKKIIAKIGNKSKKKLKNNTSAIKKIEPGKPKKIKQLIKQAKNNLGHIKFNPDISVISRVLKRRLMASTNKNEFVDKRAWLISIQKLAKSKQDCPLMTHIVNQCISTTVEYATNFFKSI